MIRATEAERVRLNELFSELCAIPSPFGHERACADRVRAELEALGLETMEDDAGAQLQGDAGNLYAHIAGEPTILFCAHLDTVVPQAEIAPVLVDGGWENAHAGILGADNKAAIAVMLMAARRRVQDPHARIGLELLFTVSEENALAGAKVFDTSRLRSDFGYVFDHATPIGEIVVASPTYYRVIADFRGRAAHAGIRPEDGRSAILAAAHAITRMPHGRLDEETTANAGNITGGVASTNVVPEHCRLMAEVRSLDAEKADTTVGQMIDALHDGAGAVDVDVDVTSEKLFTGYKAKPGAPAVQLAEQALLACGYEPKRIATGGGSDANVFEAAGFSCVNLANGTERNHEPTERVSVVALESMLDVALTLMEKAQ